MQVHATTRVPRTCLTCTRVFTLNTAKHKGERCGRYCSNACYAASRKKTVEVPCARCGAIMVGIPSKFLTRKVRYCSLTCSNRSRAQRSLADRFWASVAVVRDDGASCWVFSNPASGAEDYGRIRIGGKRIKAHRISWELHYGPIPDDLWVLHHCDNRPCVRPTHLFLGTNTDNMRDMAKKGRAGNTPASRQRAQLRAMRSAATDVAG